MAKMSKPACTLMFLPWLAACHGHDLAASPYGHDAGQQPAGNVLQALSLEEAPAPTRTFYWGAIDVSAPGFVGPPRDVFTIALDEQVRLRWLSWKTLPAFPKLFGDGEKDFPLTGTKHLDLHPDYNSVYDATVEDTGQPTPTHFLFRVHVTDTDSLNDYIESVEGTQTGGGWDVVYSDKGKFFGAAINAHAAGTLFAGDPAASGPTSEGSVWSAPVEIVAPGFAGPPVDHLTVELDGSGQLRAFGFERFTRKVTFGDEDDDLPLSGTRARNDLSVSVDDAVAPTRSHFVARYHAVGNENLSDYVEGIDGTIEGNALIVRYFMKGKLWGAQIDAHAAGALVPASPTTH